MQHDNAKGLYLIVFRTPSDEWTTAMRREIYLDDVGAQVITVYEPGNGQPGDVATAWLSALHVGTVLGWPYKLILCRTGVVIAVLSATGVVIWWRKRRGRNYLRVGRISL